jgi:hypothetical protein
METFIIILQIYFIQFLICAAINALKPNRKPKGIIDFLKMTFLPWLLLNLKNVKH